MYRSGYRFVENTQATLIIQRLQLKNARVNVSPDVDIPYVTGLFRANIYLPDVKMPDDVLEVIIKHEHQHFKSRDILIKTFYLLLSIIFWWNPIVHSFRRELDRLLEIQCDAAMVKHMNADERITYLETLLLIGKHVLQKNAVASVSASTLLQAGQIGFLSQRIEVIQNSGKIKSAKMKLVSSALVMLLFMASFLLIVQPARRPPADVVGAVTISGNNSYILRTVDGEYKLYMDGQFATMLRQVTIKSGAIEGIPIIDEIEKGG